jgi:lipoyl-dependent peroxiredoxin
MPEFKRTASVTWTGDSKHGAGQVSTGSGALQAVPYSFVTRFGEAPGTNPEELLAASHAACFSMAFASELGRSGHPPDRVETRATCFMTRDDVTGVKITRMRLESRVQVKGLDAATFQEIARAAEGKCPVSNVVRHGLVIELDAALV